MKKANKAWEESKLEKAKDLFEQAYQKSKHVFTQSYVAECLSTLEAQRGDLSSALHWANQSLKLIREVPWQTGEKRLLKFLSSLERTVGHYSQAESYLKQAQAKTSSALEKNQLLIDLVQILMEQASYSQAKELINQAKDQGPFNPLDKILFYFRLKQVANALGQPFDQEANLSQEWQALEKKDQELLKPYYDFLQGQEACLAGHYEEALSFFRQSASLFQARQDLLGQVESLLALTQPLMEFGLHEQASEVLSELLHWRGLEDLPA
ncbi:MAG: hypothetical protein KDK66_06600, partial [Deltaproteobacteria bacterium]|nr:hypothetical protein [Deltaproteobacteria bacterium]